MARIRMAARRHAEAVLQLADRDDALDQWRDDLRTAVRVIADPAVNRVLRSPMIPLAERDQLVHRLLDNQVSAQVVNLVRLLTRRATLAALPAIADEYQRLLNVRRGIVSAVVTSAAPMTVHEDAAVRRRVAGMTGTTVEVVMAVDPALIGGLTVRIGDRLIDASVRAAIGLDALGLFHVDLASANAGARVELPISVTGVLCVADTNGDGDFEVGAGMFLDVSLNIYAYYSFTLFGNVDFHMIHLKKALTEKKW